MINKWIRHITLSLYLISCCALADVTTTKPRIISLTPSFTDIVVELGAADLLVGASKLDKQRLPILSHLDTIGNFGSYSLEKIISLQPDTILIWPSAINPMQQQQLKSLGIKIIQQDPKTLDDLIENIIELGKHIDKTEEAKQLAHNMQQQLQTLKNKYHREKPLTVLYQLWDNPIYTIGKQQIINDALHICGANNIFDDIDASASEINIETVILRNPDAIIAPKQTMLEAWQTWPTIAAVKNNRLILFQDERIARPSMGMIEGINTLCTLLNTP